MSEDDKGAEREDREYKEVIQEPVGVTDEVTDDLTLKEQEQARQMMLEAAYKDRLESMSYMELIGSVLGRAQIIEEVMRMMIVRASDTFVHPRQVKGTFDYLVVQFKELYPNEGFLIDLLETGRDTRNGAAHDDLLVALFISDLLSDEHSEEDIDRFNRRGMRKTVEGMDWLLKEMLKFLREHPVDFEPWTVEVDGA
jgi:hypothetical protein